MTEADRNALARLGGAAVSPRASTDDLQSLLLQVVLALLMVFIIAYFMFVQKARREQEESILELNRQKLVVAVDKTAEDYRIRYGLNALMTQGTDGRRVFDADALVADGTLALAPAAREAFASGAKAALDDMSNHGRWSDEWRTRVMASAGLTDADLDDATRDWLAQTLAERVEAVRLDVRGVQRSLAARLQRSWIERPEAIADDVVRTAASRFEGADPSQLGSIAADLTEVMKRRSLELLSQEAGGCPMLP